MLAVSEIWHRLVELIPTVHLTGDVKTTDVAPPVLQTVLNVFTENVVMQVSVDMHARLMINALMAKYVKAVFVSLAVNLMQVAQLI